MTETRKPDPYAVDQSAAKASAPGAPAAGSAEPSLFSSRVQDGIHVITFEQSNVLDAYEIERLGDGIYHHVKTFDSPKVVVDLGNVQHLSSAALGMLIALRKVVVDKKSGGLCIANVNKDLQEIFKMTNLDKLLKIHGSTEKAVQSL